MEPFNHAVLASILSARHLTLKGVSERLQVSEETLRAAIAENPRPNNGIISDLSAQLSVPAFVFYMDRPPEISPGMVDFRHANPAPTPKLPSTVESIELAKRLQEVANELNHSDAMPRGIALRQIISPDFAGEVRERLGITNARQTQAESPAKFYSFCRAAVEAEGIFVIQDSFPAEDGSGFCLADGPSRFIVINTRRQNHGRRNFTLFHELGHVLLGRSGVSDPFIAQNSIERACNLFSALVLVPVALAKMAFEQCHVSTQPSLDEIRRCAKYLNISQQATVVRLEQLKLVTEGSHVRWLDAVRANGNPDFGKTGGGGGNVAQERVKLAKYGFTFAQVFGSAVKNASISPLELYRMSGLKPKYQRPYFAFASNAGPDDAEE